VFLSIITRAPKFESGQIVVDKSRCWDALMLTLHYNENSPFYYLYMHGDKETFHMAWRKTNTPYFMAPEMHAIPMTMIQKDPHGEILFQHRNTAKWKIGQHVEGFLLEDECMKFLKEYPTN
jgi:alpha 1,2-mannosyltransferase